MRHCRANVCASRAAVGGAAAAAGTTSARTGMLGLYLATRLAVRPVDAYATIRPACNGDLQVSNQGASALQACLKLQRGNSCQKKHHVCNLQQNIHGVKFFITCLRPPH